jgi:heat shock protein HslJ
MSIDLETELRDAFRARAAAVTPASLRRAGAPPARRPRSPLGPVLAAAAIVAALAVSLAVWPKDHAADRGQPAAGPAAVPRAGTSWRLERLWSPDGTTARAPARLRATLGFAPDGTIRGYDTVNGITADYRATARGFAVSAAVSTGIGYPGRDRVQLAVMQAMQAIFSDAGGDPVRVESHVDGDRLTLLVSGYTLQFQRV